MTIAAVSMETLQTACLACANAIDSGDYATARTKCAVAEALLAGLPAQGQKGGMMLQYRQQLASLRTSIEALQANAGRAADRDRLITTGMSFG